MNLAGKHVLVTGAGKRVGRAIAELLLDPARGPDVRLTAHYRSSRAEADALAAWGRARGRDVRPAAADLADVAALRRLVADAEQALGPVDVLVNSASDFYPTPADTVTETEWDHFHTVNAKGQFFLAQAVAPGMRQRGAGVIVNIGDVNAERPVRGYAPYVASKGALSSLTRALAKEWAPTIRVNAVHPGAVLLPESYTEEQKRKAVARAPLGRWGTAHDVAYGVLFLVENDYVTGFGLNVDGGRSIA
jgi:NAD(P)-dependent dehydrogenase (short-subunit alcohol dehydrogenase family)